MKKLNSINSKNESMQDKSDNSRNSETGYLHRGNPAVVQQEARVKRNDDNGSHY